MEWKDFTEEDKKMAELLSTDKSEEEQAKAVEYFKAKDEVPKIVLWEIRHIFAKHRWLNSFKVLEKWLETDIHIFGTFVSGLWDPFSPAGGFIFETLKKHSKALLSWLEEAYEDAIPGVKDELREILEYAKEQEGKE